MALLMRLFSFQKTNSSTCPTMSRRANAPYFKGNGYQTVILPYKGGRMEMVIVMPDPGKFIEFEQTLDQKLFNRILAEVGR